jgi:hypothetical protein
VATLQEIENHYCTTDVLDRNTALDAWHRARRLAEEKAARR